MMPMELCFAPGTLEAGCDEAGRGCLAGPVVAAAVILPEGFSHPWLNDSKQVTERRREALRPIIEEQAVAWGVGICSPREIDELNILRASITAMHRALDALKVRPESVIVDGNRFYPYTDPAGRQLPWHTFVKGDARYANIAAASILAHYHWDVNKGYPTPDHRAAIAAHGATPHHRLTFRLLPPTQLTLWS